MKKLFASALLFSFALTAGVSANWITGESTIIAVNQGEAAFHAPLSSEQRLDVGMTSGASAVRILFSQRHLQKINYPFPGYPLKLNQAPAKGAVHFQMPS